MSNPGSLTVFDRAATGILAMTVHRLQDLAGINSIEKTAPLVDAIPGHVFYGMVQSAIFRLVRVHHVLPERLGHRRGRQVEIMDLDWPAIRFTAEEIGPAACATDPHELKRVLLALSSPLIRQGRHWLEAPVWHR